MDESATTSSVFSLTSCWHWAATLVVLIIGWAVYLLWFAPPSEYDSEVPPGHYNPWFWMLGTVVVLAVVLIVENRKKCFSADQH